MMLYEGRFLNITWEKEQDLFVQFWKASPKTLSEFKQEMLVYASYYKQYKPKYTLWRQQNFQLQLKPSTYTWIEQHINIPCKIYGNERCAFIVSKDVLAHLTVIDAFEKIDSCIINEHFASEEEARQWLKDKDQPVVPEKKSTNDQLFFEGVDEEGRPILKLPKNISSLKNTIKSLRKTLITNHFIVNNTNKYNQLTLREREIAGYLASGLSKKQIASELHISIGTVQTHTKNIYTKLEINKVTELSLWVENFKL